nr:microfibrillar-associated protein 2 isoform X1 [Anas platyrhynchos]
MRGQQPQFLGVAPVFQEHAAADQHPHHGPPPTAQNSWCQLCTKSSSRLSPAIRQHLSGRGGGRGRIRCRIRTQWSPHVGGRSFFSHFGVFEPREKRPRRWARAKAAHSIRSDRTALLHLPPGPVTMRALCLVLLGLPAALLVQGQYSRFEGITYPEPVQYSQYDQQAEIQDYYDYHDVTPRTPEEQFRYQSQQQSQQEIVPAPTPAAAPETEPTEPGPLDCREEQYPCTRLYSVHKPCKQCLNEICFYSLRRVYVINKEICVRTVCAHEELLRADLCRDKFSKCGVMATSGLCQTVVASCARSCGGC